MADMQIVLAKACKNVEAQYVEMMVPLYSHGCEKKVKKTLSHLKGIYSVKVDYDQQKVTVWGICNKYDVLATVRSKRKDACFWNPQDNAIASELESQPPSDSSSPPISSTSRYANSSLALIRVRSLSLKLKAWKKVFTRSYSLP